MSIIDRVFEKIFPFEKPNAEIEEVQEEDTLEYIEERALNLLIDALYAEKEKIVSDALLITQEDSREKINYEDMVLALQKNGFSVELLDRD